MQSDTFREWLLAVSCHDTKAIKDAELNDKRFMPGNGFRSQPLTSVHLLSKRKKIPKKIQVFSGKDAMEKTEKMPQKRCQAF
jgi:hypothetical protein